MAENEKKEAVVPSEIKQEAVVPSEIKDFVGLLKDHEVTEAKAIAIGKFISRTGSPEVFEKPEELADFLARYPRELAPVQRRRILEQWFAEKGVPVPEDLLTKTTMTHKEADKAEKDKDKQRKIAEGAVWTVDVDEKGIARPRRIKDTSEPGTTLEEATKAAKQINKDYVGEEALVAFNESLGRHMPNFKSDFVKKNTGAAWAMAREMDKAMQQGTEVDPMDVFIEQIAKLEQMKEITGIGKREPEAKGTLPELIAGVKDLQEMAKSGKAVELPSWMTDPAAFIETVQKVTGGERGSPDWMSDPAKFIEMVRTITGEPKTDEGLKTELAEMKKSFEDMKEQRYLDQITALAAQNKAITDKMDTLMDTVADLKKPVTGMTEMDLINKIATEGIGVLKSELPGLRSDVREAFRGGALPAPKTPQEREDRKERYRETLEKDKKIEELGKRLFFPQGS